MEQKRSVENHLGDAWGITPSLHVVVCFISMYLLLMGIDSANSNIEHVGHSPDNCKWMLVHAPGCLVAVL